MTQFTYYSFLMHKKKAFTLVELLLVIIIASSILTTLFSILTTMPRVKNYNDARMTMIEQTNSILERLNLLIQGYDIDYEEYFNRKQTGCSGWGEANQGNNFSWNISQSGHCRNFTTYGNENRWKIQTSEQIQNQIYYCSSSSTETWLNPLDACWEGSAQMNIQSYGQYKQLFWDVGKDTDETNIPGVSFNQVGDSDDRDLGRWPIAIGDANNIQELYLISPDETRRILLRRKFVADRKSHPDDTESTPQYTLQILKLRGFDAGSAHDFNIGWQGVGIFDGKIDTRACDYGEGFMCGGMEIPSYPWYRLPANNEDGWVNLLNDNISLDHRNLKIIPTKKPEYAWMEADQQINPYIKISVSTSLTPHLWGNKLWGNLTGFSYTLPTLFNTKTFYIK